MGTDTKTMPCLKCGKTVRKRSRNSAYCGDCFRVAKICNSCGTPIAGHNKRGLCLPCQKITRKAKPLDMGDFDWWEDR